MLDLLTKLIKFVVVDGDIYVNIDMIYHNGMNSIKYTIVLSHPYFLIADIKTLLVCNQKSRKRRKVQSGISPNICKMRWLHTETAVLLHTSA